jgi:hypothetical protein
MTESKRTTNHGGIRRWANELAFLYQEETSGGAQSRFSKLVNRNGS